MEKNSLHHDTLKVKIYRKSYRPSSNFIQFFKSIGSVLITGNSPVGRLPNYQIKKFR